MTTSTPDTVVWLDLFSINHHRPPPSNIDIEGLRANICGMERFSIIGSPLQVFNRTWCILECVLAGHANKSFELICSDDDFLVIETQLLSQQYKAVDDILGAVDSTHSSQCSNMAQGKAIVHILQSFGGGGPEGQLQIQAALRSYLRKWLIEVIEKKILPGVTKLPIPRASLQDILQQLHFDSGDFELANRCLISNLKINMPGQDIDIVEVLNQMMDVEMYAAAEGVYNVILDSQVRNFGSGMNPLEAVTLATMSDLCAKQDKHSEAVAYMERAIEICDNCRDKMDDSSSFKLSCLGKISQLYSKNDQIEKSLDSLERVMRIKISLEADAAQRAKMIEILLSLALTNIGLGSEREAISVALFETYLPSHIKAYVHSDMNKYMMDALARLYLKDSAARKQSPKAVLFLQERLKLLQSVHGNDTHEDVVKAAEDLEQYMENSC